MRDESYFSIDIETSGLNRFKDRILGIGLYSPSGSYYFDTVSALRDWCDVHPNAKFIAHRGSFDFNFLRHHGLDLSSRFDFDTRSIASLLIPGPGLAEGQKKEFGLENLAIQLLGEQPYKLDRTDMTSYTPEEVKQYCLKDCEFTYRIFEVMLSRFDSRSWQFVTNWLMPATKFCMELEWNGVPIDVDGLKWFQGHKQRQRDRILKYLNQKAEPAIKFYHEKQVKEVSQQYREMYQAALGKLKSKEGENEEKQKEKKEKCLRRYALLESAAISRLEPFNWNSSEQLKWLLRDYYCLDIHNDREDKETTNEAMLRSLDHPVARLLCMYRELEKLVSTCIPALLENAEDSFVYAGYNVGGTRTGRLSSSGPNLQQIPRGRIRSYVRSNAGRVLVTIDYSQIEVRIIAELAKEKELIHAFKEDIDPYSVIAQKLLKIDCDVRKIKEKFKKERDVSKTAGLSILYGTGAAKLQEVLNKELNKNYSLRECKAFIEDYRSQFPGIQQLRKELDRRLANGKIVYNLLGRPFAIESNDDIYMRGLNSLVQGSASDLVIYSQTAFVIPELESLGVQFKHRMLIHDEVVIELPADEAEILTHEVIVPAMTTKIEKQLKLSTPLKVEFSIGRAWEKP